MWYGEWLCRPDYKQSRGRKWRFEIRFSQDVIETRWSSAGFGIEGHRGSLRALSRYIVCAITLVNRQQRQPGSSQFSSLPQAISQCPIIRWTDRAERARLSHQVRDQKA